MSRLPEPPDPWVSYRRLLGIAHRYRWLIVAAMVAMVIEAASGAAFMSLMEPLVDEGFVQRNPQAGWFYPLLIVGLFLLRGLATFVTDYGMARAGRSVVRDLRMMLMAKYLRLPCTHYDAEPVQVMVSRLNYDTEQVAQASSEALKTLITDTLLIVFLLGVMLSKSVAVTLTMLVVAPVIAAIVAVVGRRYRRLNSRIQENVAELAHRAEQMLQAHQEIRVHGAQTQELGRYRRLADRLLGLNTKVESTRAMSSSTVQLLGATALAVIVYVAGIEAAAGRLSPGQFVALMTSMMALLPSLKRITTVQSQLARGIAAAQKIFSVLDAEEEPDRGRVELVRARGEIEFRNVRLRYHEDGPWVLDGISFTARPGMITAIVGRSGSGKTTLVRLLPRFYAPDEGEILLDGRPLQDYRLADLRRQIAMVGQQVVLFDDTVMANIALGTEHPDPQLVRTAARVAHALEFIDTLPGGLEAGVGDKGGRLSGGQRQRLAIARAVFRDAPVLILDEATAALDSHSERLVQEALDRLLAQRTSFIIAHRLATVEHAHQVLVLDQGRLVEQGTHAELLARGGLYTALHRMQFRDADGA